MERYTAKPWDIILYALPTIFLGAVMFGIGWEAFGVITFILGLLMGLWVVVTGIWQAHGEYIDRLSSDAKDLETVKDPEVWAALGYEKSPPALPARIETPVDGSPGTPKLEFPQPPISTIKMRLFANTVLRGGSMSESYWVNNGAFTGDGIRKFKDWLEQKEFIRLNNPDYPTLGFTRTKRGEKFFLFYADEDTKQMYQTAQSERPNPKTISNGGDVLSNPINQ